MSDCLRGHFTEAKVAKFSGEYSGNSLLFYKNKLFFSSNRNQDQLSDSLNAMHWTLKPNSKIWFVELVDDKWNEPELFSNPFDKVPKIMNLNFSSNGNMYFLSFLAGVNQQCGIFYAKKKRMGFFEPEALPESINSNYQDWTPFIAPDESYLLFSSSRCKDKNDTGDIYISFRNTDGSWTSPEYLDDKINSDRPERFPSVTPDGKYLLFSRFVSRGNEDVMWVSAGIIEKVKAKVCQDAGSKQQDRKEEIFKAVHLSESLDESEAYIRDLVVDTS